MRLAALFPLVFLVGCAGSFEEARAPRVKLGIAAPKRDAVHCDDLDAQHRTWAFVAAVSGGLAAGSGLSSIPDLESKEIRTGLAIGAAVSGAMALGATAMSNGAATSWARDCQ